MSAEVLGEAAPTQPPSFQAAATDRKSDAVLLFMPTPLAGMGTARQLAEAARGLEAALPPGTPWGYVGSPTVTGHQRLQTPLAALTTADGVAERYQAATDAMEAALRGLVGNDRRDVLVVCMGYTSYGPEAVKRAVARMRADGEECRARALITDSAYPDTDAPETEVPAPWPVTRFCLPSYASTPEVETYFLVTSAYGYDPSILSRRAPPGLAGVAVIAPPYTDGYLEDLRRAATTDLEHHLSALGAVPGLSSLNDQDLLIPFLSSDIWDEGAIGQWMTRPQYESVVAGTIRVYEALGSLARRLGRRVLVPTDVTGARFLRGRNVPGVTVLARRGDPAPDRGAIVCPYQGLPQLEHAALIGRAPFVISRTGGQANSTVVAAVVETANIAIDLPAAGYMQSELSTAVMENEVHVDEVRRVAATARSDPLGWVASGSWETARLVSLFEAVTTDARERDIRAANMRRALDYLRASDDGNLFSIVPQLT